MLVSLSCDNRTNWREFSRDGKEIFYSLCHLANSIIHGGRRKPNESHHAKCSASLFGTPQQPHNSTRKGSEHIAHSIIQESAAGCEWI